MPDCGANPVAEFFLHALRKDEIPSLLGSLASQRERIINLAR